jgi:hypothetical protein
MPRATFSVNSRSLIRRPTRLCSRTRLWISRGTEMRRGAPTRVARTGSTGNDLGQPDYCDQIECRPPV